VVFDSSRTSKHASVLAVSSFFTSASSIASLHPLGLPAPLLDLNPRVTYRYQHCAGRSNHSATRPAQAIAQLEHSSVAQGLRKDWPMGKTTTTRRQALLNPHRAP
jgi:hypothetical protein